VTDMIVCQVASCLARWPPCGVITPLAQKHPIWGSILGVGYVPAGDDCRMRGIGGRGA
jgi:hypothetical protein